MAVINDNHYGRDLVREEDVDDPRIEEGELTSTDLNIINFIKLRNQLRSIVGYNTDQSYDPENMSMETLNDTEVTLRRIYRLAEDLGDGELAEKAIRTAGFIHEAIECDGNLKRSDGDYFTLTYVCRSNIGRLCSYDIDGPHTEL